MVGVERTEQIVQLVFDPDLVPKTRRRRKIERELISEDRLKELSQEKRPPWLSTDEAWEYLKGLNSESRWFIEHTTVFHIVGELIAFPFESGSPSSEIGVLSIMAEWRENLDRTLKSERKAQRVVHKLAGMNVGQRLRGDQGYHSDPGTKRSFGETAHQTRFAWEHDCLFHPEVNVFVENLTELDWWFLTSLHPRLDFEVPRWSKNLGDIGGRIYVRKRAFDPDKFDPDCEREAWEKERKWWLLSWRLSTREEMPESIGMEFYPEWLALPPWKKEFLLANPTFWPLYSYVFGRTTAKALAEFASSGTKAMPDALEPFQGKYTDGFKEAGKITAPWGLSVQRAVVDLENGSAQSRDSFWFLVELLENIWGLEIEEMLGVSDRFLFSLSERERLFNAFLGPVQEAVEKSQEIPLDPVEPLPVKLVVNELREVYGLHIDLNVNDGQEVGRITRLLMIIARETMRPEYHYQELKNNSCLCLPEVRVGGGHRLDFVGLPWDWAEKERIQRLLEQTCPEDPTGKRIYPNLEDIFEDEEETSPRANRETIILAEMKARFGSQLFTRDRRGSLETLVTGASACRELGLDQRYDLKFQLIELTAWQREVIEMSFEELLEFAPQPFELVEAVL
jgi:hypothetical protein